MALPGIITLQKKVVPDNHPNKRTATRCHKKKVQVYGVRRVGRRFQELHLLFQGG